MITWFAKNSVAANLLMISILVAGLFSLNTSIPLEVFPSFETHVVSVRVSLPGATPQDVEKSVTIRIEEAVQDLEGIDQIRSTSGEGSAAVYIDIDDNYDPQTLLADIKSRVDAVNTFPADAERPVISLAQHTHDVITVTLASDYGEHETREYAQNLRDEMLRLDGVTQLELDGIRNYEITINVSQNSLRQYGLTLSDISSAIGKSSIDISSGNLRTLGGDILLRSSGQAYRKNDFAKIAIKTNKDGSKLLLEDIAQINDGFEETPVRTRFNGKNAVFVEVYRIGDQSAIEVADKIKTFIKDRQATLPQGYELSYWDDDSAIVKNRISTLTNSALQGGILVLALLTLFLRPAIAFWVFIGIPISFMGAFLLMPVFGVTLNILSLFGFILVLGIVVDDAIVTGENIYTHLNRAESGEDAVINGTLEVAKPVTFGVLTTVAAFLPLAFIEGMRGPMFSQIPAVVIPILLFSLIESKFVLPSHLKHIKLRTQKTKVSRFEHYQQKFADGFERAILKYYRPILDVCLNNKLTTLLSFLSIFCILIALILSGWTKFTFFPRIPSETVRVTLTMPAGTPFEVTNRHILTLSENAKKLREKYRDPETGESFILNILSVTGGRGGTSNEGRVRFEITPPEQRSVEISSQQLVNEWRKLNGDIAGAESLAYRAEFGRGGNPIDIQLSANSLQTLRQVSEIVKDHLATYPTVFDIADTLSDGKEELQIELTDQGKAIGLTRQEVASQIRNAYYGTQAQRIQRGRDDVKVMVRLPLEERRSIANLQNLLIRTSNGNEIPLAQVASLQPGKGPSAINRIDRFRTVNISADIEKGKTNMTVLTTSLRGFMDELVTRYPDVGYSLEGEAREQRESFGSLGWSLLGVLFAIYVLLAIPFKSYAQPLIVMSVIPFGLVGAVLGHWIMGSNLTLLSLMGMLALTGVVVNDALVLVDYINQQRARGMSLQHAVLNAGTARFRPVMLTSLTTFIGLVPLLFEKSTQAQFLIPMAISLGFGILFATFITLIMIPVNYILLENARRFLNQLYSRGAKESKAPSV
ncbi:acriflavin resistance protein [Terasakiella brassicae]|uniref:Acriflavin resistance protein n=1 Tax=Terasakiella brassicae TaxID=1634917 RepID=A0A917BY43_9PROT|nr:efflux RND transporter permease subunit [Terasakiella brassicae]GGF63180.1 acriflavin resistance protein [Terasakiella brassicae]